MAPFVFEDQPPAAAAQPIAPQSTTAQPAAPRYVFEDVPTPPPQPKGVLEAAVSSFAGAAARMAQGVNSSLGAINKGFGLDSGIYDENAAYWEQKAQEAGSDGLPAKVYEGIGAAPAGIAEFVAGVPYAAVKGAAEGYQESGIPGALEGAALESAKRFGIGKVFKAIEALPLSPMQRAGAMGGTMGVQTGAEGGSPEDIVAATVTGAALSVPTEGGRQSTIRRNLTREGVQPEIAADLAARVQESPRFAFEDSQAEPARTDIRITGPDGKPLDVPLDTRPPEAIGPLVAETGNGKVFIPDFPLAISWLC